MRCWNKSLFEKIKDLSYDAYMRSISASYYLREVSEYYSLITFIIIGTLCRFSYNNWYYPSFSSELTSTAFERLLIQMTILFAIETCSDFIMRILMKLISGHWIVELGQEQTIGCTRTRFLFTLFVVHYLHDIYYAIQVVYTPNMI